MSFIKPQEKDLQPVQDHHSDGRELVPAEVQVSIRSQHDPSSTQEQAIPGTTVDDEGLLNNFAVEPNIYPAEYPSPPQQRRYILLGAAAIVLVALLTFIAFTVS